MHPWLDIRIPIGSHRIDGDPRTDIKKRLGRAIRACRLGGRATQDEVAERTGIGQSTLSSYENGKSVPDALQLLDIEMACDRPAGWIAVQAGLVSGITTAAEAIAMDPALNDGARRTLSDFYAGVVESVKKDTTGRQHA